MNINCDSYWYETRNREKYNEQEGNHVVTLVKVTRAQLNDDIFIDIYSISWYWFDSTQWQIKNFIPTKIVHI